MKPAIPKPIESELEERGGDILQKTSDEGWGVKTGSAGPKSHSKFTGEQSPNKHHPSEAWPVCDKSSASGVKVAFWSTGRSPQSRMTLSYDKGLGLVFIPTPPVRNTNRENLFYGTGSLWYGAEMRSPWQALAPP